MGDIHFATMSTFNCMFDKDRFTVYKTWGHNPSVVYRLTTWTNTMPWQLLAAGCQDECYFLESPEARIRFRLRRPQARTPRAPAGSTRWVIQYCRVHAVQKAALWQTTSGDDIVHFCRRNAKNLEVGVQEVGHQRIFMIIWAPHGGKLGRKTWMHSSRRTLGCN